MSDSEGIRRTPTVISFLAAICVLAGALTYTFQIGALSGQFETQANGYAANYSHDTEQQIKACSREADRNVATECVKEALRASRESQRSEQDLSTQRQMSEWAFWSLIVAISSATITALGTYLIYQQIILTRKAVEETGRATAEMEIANQISRQAIETGNRAWIAFTDFAKSRIIDPDGKVIGYAIECRGRNTGNTPAFNAYSVQISELTADETPLEILKFIENKAYREPFDKAEKVVITPGGPSRGGVVQVTLEQIKNFGSGPMNFFMYVRAEYTTIGSSEVRYTSLIAKAGFNPNLPATDRWESFEFGPWGPSEMT